VHEGGFRVALLPSGEKQFWDPAGALVSPGPDTRFCGNVAALTSLNSRSAPGINAATLPPQWQGERMDLGMAVEALLRRQGGR